MKKVFVTCLLAAPVLLLFQNCSKTTYHAADDSSRPGYLTDVDGEENPNEVSDLEEVPDSEDPPAPVPAPEPSDATGEYICILQGPGDSTKLGLAQEAMQSQHRTPDLICMTQTACSDIVSKAFDVKGAKRAGFCKAHGNPHVIHLTEKEIQSKVDDLLKSQP